MPSQSYTAVALAITQYRDSHAATLAAAAAAARQASYAQLRADLTALSEPGSPAHEVACYLSTHVTIGRESDDYPEVIFAPEARALLRAAVAAGVLALDGTARLRVIVGRCRFLESELVLDQTDYLHEDYRAWDAHRRYLAKQTTI